MTLIALLIAAIVLPCVYVAAMAFSDLRAREADATDLTLRTVRVAEEHALKVFDMNEALDARVVDLVQGLDDDGIRAREAEIHDKLRTMGGGYPQVAAVSIFGQDGTLLASSRFYPGAGRSRLPIATISSAFATARCSSTSRRRWSGQVAGEKVFNTGVARRGADGCVRRRGLGRAAARLFQRVLPRTARRQRSTPMTMSLTRADGAVLAHYPVRARASRSAIAPHRRLPTRSRKGAAPAWSGCAPMFDDDNLIVAFRRVGAYPVYVSCGYRTSAIWAGVVPASERADPVDVHAVHRAVVRDLAVAAAPRRRRGSVGALAGGSVDAPLDRIRVPAVAQDGSARQSGRQRRARFQQPADDRLGERADRPAARRAGTRPRIVRHGARAQERPVAHPAIARRRAQAAAAQRDARASNAGCRPAANCCARRSARRSRS